MYIHMYNIYKGLNHYSYRNSAVLHMFSFFVKNCRSPCSKTPSTSEVSFWRSRRTSSIKSQTKWWDSACSTFLGDGGGQQFVFFGFFCPLLFSYEVFGVNNVVSSRVRGCSQTTSVCSTSKNSDSGSHTIPERHTDRKGSRQGFWPRRKPFLGFHVQTVKTSRLDHFFFLGGVLEVKHQTRNNYICTCMKR